MLRIGIGREVSLQNQLLLYSVPEELKLTSYTFNKQFSYNVKVQSLQVVSLPKEALETFGFIDNLPPITGILSYLIRKGCIVCDVSFIKYLFFDRK